MAEREYPLGHSAEETQRLIQQAQRGDLNLRRLLEDAGIEPGMRVLDLGSGAGDVAMTAAALVGEAGTVVGVDKNPAILETARERARAAGLTNVAFAVGNLDGDLNLDGEFDAVVGRFVLQYVADPAATLRSVLRHLRSGGIVAMIETNTMTAFPQAFPPSPLFARTVAWRAEALAKTGTDLAGGWRLYQTLLDAGLSEPQMRAAATVVTRDSGLQGWITMLRSLRPVMIQHGIATEEELDLDTIAEQLRAEFVAERKIVVTPLHFSAWAAKP